MIQRGHVGPLDEASADALLHARAPHLAPAVRERLLEEQGATRSHSSSCPPPAVRSNERRNRYWHGAAESIHPRPSAVCVAVRSLSDESLLAGLASSDPDGSAAFIRRFQGRVYGLAMTIVGDPSIAEEVAQESFMRAWRHAATFDPKPGASDQRRDFDGTPVESRLCQEMFPFERTTGFEPATPTLASWQKGLS
jgi:hypothetical protein